MVAKKQTSRKVAKTKAKTVVAPKKIQKPEKEAKQKKSKASITPKSRRSTRFVVDPEGAVEPDVQKEDPKPCQVEQTRSEDNLNKSVQPALSNATRGKSFRLAALTRSLTQQAGSIEHDPNRERNLQGQFAARQKRIAQITSAPGVLKTFGYTGGPIDDKGCSYVWFFDEKLVMWRMWDIQPDGHVIETFHLLPPAAFVHRWEQMFPRQCFRLGAHLPTDYAFYTTDSRQMGMVKLPIVILHWNPRTLGKLPLKHHLPFNLDVHMSRISPKDLTDPCVYLSHQELKKRRRQNLPLVNDTDVRGFPKCTAAARRPPSPPPGKTYESTWESAFGSLGVGDPKDSYSFYSEPEGYTLTLRKPLGIEGEELETWYAEANNGPLVGLAKAVGAPMPKNYDISMFQRPKSLPTFDELSSIATTRGVEKSSQMSSLPFTRSTRRTASAMNSPSQLFYMVKKYSDAGDISPE